jgi:ubiquinone biosynthesis protein
LYEFLKGRKPQPDSLMADLLTEQKRTNRLLQGVLYGGFGFLLGLLAMQLWTRLRFF